MAREINLVPNSKFEAIKAIKIRNFIMFLCIAVAGGAIAVVFVLGTIVGGQGLILDGKDKMLTAYSEKINSYTELSDFLTIKDQLDKLQTLSNNKNLFSRVFKLVPVFSPTNGDTVSFSKIDIDLGDDEVSFVIEAQANALTEPYIDYNVLDAFKKAMDYYRYDYGTYVNELGDVIPSYCIIENDSDGAFLKEDGKYYAFWTAKVDGCDPRHPVDLLEEDVEEETEDEALEDEDVESEDTEEEDEEKEMEYTYELFNGEEVVRIWRTPLFAEWYKEEYMDLGGSIYGIPHFESSCYTYSGTLDEETGEAYYKETNDTCLLINEGVDGFKIESSSNGRSQDEELVLTFKGTISITPEFFKLQNTHMMALGPNRRYNVTDSFVQVQSLFVAPADPCGKDDLECRNGGK